MKYSNPHRQVYFTGGTVLAFPTSHMRALGMLILIYGCSDDTTYTGVRVRTHFNASLQVDQVRVTGTKADGSQAFTPQLAPAVPRPLLPDEDLVILFDEAFTATQLAVRVDALQRGTVVASARQLTSAARGAVVEVDLTLTDPAFCGDGKLHLTAEDCDDANTRDSDGCSAVCTVEPRYRCTGSPSVCLLPGGSPPTSTPISTCGDGTCNTDENSCNCGADCGADVCGDGICCGGTGEDTCTCAEDCGAQICGDGRCCAPLGEDVCNCATDCGGASCGDGLCCAAELCEQDCGAACTQEGPPGDASCSDGVDNDCDQTTDNADSDCVCSGGCCPRTCTNACNLTCNAAACECNVNCEANPERCKVNCTDGATCRINCKGTGTCDVDCRDTSTCHVDCTGGDDCTQLRCRDNSTCFFDCRADGNCSNVRCDNQARCYLQCEGDQCGCAGGLLCPNGMIACNGAPCL